MSRQSVCIESVPGDIHYNVNRAIEVAQVVRGPVTLVWNGTDVTVYPNHCQQVCAAWYAQRGGGESA